MEFELEYRLIRKTTNNYGLADQVNDWAKEGFRVVCSDFDFVYMERYIEIADTQA